VVVFLHVLKKQIMSKFEKVHIFEANIQWKTGILENPRAVVICLKDDLSEGARGQKIKPYDIRAKIERDAQEKKIGIVAFMQL
jgi:hypothetical protein